jgi:hypothetical protein
MELEHRLFRLIINIAVHGQSAFVPGMQCIVDDYSRARVKGKGKELHPNPMTLHGRRLRNQKGGAKGSEEEGKDPPDRVR